MHLRRVQRHRQHPAGAGRDQQVGDEPAADRHPGHVLLVRAGVGVVRDHRRHPGRRGAPGRVEHQQQLDQVLLHRRGQRLDQEDVAFPAVGLQLNFQAVVGEPADDGGLQRDAEVPADLRRQVRWAVPLKIEISRTPPDYGQGRPSAPQETQPDLGHCLHRNRFRREPAPNRRQISRKSLVAPAPAEWVLPNGHADRSRRSAADQPDRRRHRQPGQHDQVAEFEDLEQEEPAGGLIGRPLQHVVRGEVDPARSLARGEIANRLSAGADYPGVDNDTADVTRG